VRDYVHYNQKVIKSKDRQIDKERGKEKQKEEKKERERERQRGKYLVNFKCST
jgi:hypothetical protein